jgi:hypothetical protein
MAAAEAGRQRFPARLLAPPFPLDRPAARRLGLVTVVGWLEAQPGDTWHGPMAAQRRRRSGGLAAAGHRLEDGPGRSAPAAGQSPASHRRDGHLIVIAEGAGDPVRTSENIARLDAEVLPGLRKRVSSRPVRGAG